MQLFRLGEYDFRALEVRFLDDAQVDGAIDVYPELGALLEHGARHGGEVHLEEDIALRCAHDLSPRACGASALTV
jgi:hypothetical protein